MTFAKFTSLVSVFTAISTLAAAPDASLRLTPPESPAPRINGAKVFGARPGSPFLYTVAASGERPLTFGAKDLPEGLSLDQETGRITGVLKKEGEYLVTLTVSNAKGNAERGLKIVCGKKLALTPTMGWNSWNCFGRNISAESIRQAADAMVASGLVNYGWTYINIDDGWAGKRNADGEMVPNEHFPDMKGLADYVHGKGLKIGLYSSPGKYTCAGFAGSYGHEARDAKSYADWGFDFLKYDMCSYDGEIKPDNHQERMLPFLLMGQYLKRQKRDIVYNLCQYGYDSVWTWGASVGAQSWRTTGDIWDGWQNGKSSWEHGVASIGFSQNGLEQYAGPGNWNDPDMLVVGVVGWGKPRPSNLTPDEQYTHVSLWSLLSAPLVIGADMTKLDEFTLGLLTNSEVIDINQDALGRQGYCRVKRGDAQIWVKPLEDGSLAVGLFNLGDQAVKIAASWEDLAISGRQMARDVWRNQDIGVMTDSVEREVAGHGVSLLRLIPQEQFFIGADLSGVPVYEKYPGFKYDGKSVDIFKLFRRQGHNSVRLRVWNNNKDGECGMDEVAALARRAHDEGMSVLLNFHYSDWWADPQTQTKPAAWKDLPFPELCAAVKQFTKESVARLVEQGTPPAMVQVGNEIRNGMLWPDGDVNKPTPEGLKRLAELFRAGAEGVREASPAGKPIPVMLHVDAGGYWKLNQPVLEVMKREQVAYDIIGISYYPGLSGSMADLRESMAQMARLYDKDIVIAEISYPWKQPMPYGVKSDFPATKEGLAQLLKAVAREIKQVPDGRGKGIYYWGAEIITGSRANEALFDEHGNALTNAIQALVP